MIEIFKIKIMFSVSSLYYIRLFLLTINEILVC